MGLEFLKEAIPDINENPDILQFLSQYTDLGLLSTLLFLGIGTLLTVVIQSSSAVMALTLVMCYNGWISFDIAAAMVLGENIGTTITANLAALVTNVTAKRAARSHLIFNVFGVIWVLIVFPIFLKGIAWFVILLGGSSPYESATAIPVALSIFHTTFNILNVLLLIGFVPLIVKIVEWLVRQKENEDEVFRLQHIDRGLLSTPELSIYEAKKEIATYGERVAKMFNLIPDLIMEKNTKTYSKLLEKVRKYEGIINRMELEIAEYLTKVSESELSVSSSQRIRAMLKVIDDIESIGDSCDQITISVENKNNKKIWFTQDLRDNLWKMFDLINEGLYLMNKNLAGEYHHVNIEKALEIENKINQLRNELRQEHVQKVECNEYENFHAGMYYRDIYALCEKMGDYIINVSEALDEYNRR